MKLVIVESPTKAKTIQKFLDSGFIVQSSYGHIRDLPENKLGVEIENNFKPNYIILPKAKKRVQELKKYLSKAEKTILATDEDREGEAIAWHLVHALGLKNPKSKIRNPKIERIVFHEITKEAIKEALKNPRDIDINLVNAQQARRILDRLVGYKLSPFLWKKVKRGLSAGRVQSVAVRLICEREKEIEEFKPQEYWTIVALFSKIDEKKVEFEAILYKKANKVIDRLEIKTKEEAEKIIEDLKGADYQVAKIEKTKNIYNPPPPFTTSLLQQEAGKKLGYSTKFTMRVAQNLYEKGFITYHRTDSFNLSEKSLFLAKKVIEEKFGKNYWAGFYRKYKTKSKTAQEAHEAIRPTNPELIPKSYGGKVIFKEKSEEKIYDLIWRRFIATQMAQARINSTKVEIEAIKEKNVNYSFLAEGKTIEFEGFMKVYPLSIKEKILPDLKEKEPLKLKKITPYQHFTKPPSRYSEATLVKTLEKYGIGRPSTYAPIISTIQERGYVEKDENKKLKPTEIGIIVNDLLTTHFPEIVDIQFTAKMEKELDEIAIGKISWQKPLKEFYFPFEKELKIKEKEVKKWNLNKETNEICPECGAPLLLKWGKFGRFYACSNFPKCNYTKPLFESTGIICPKCKKGEIRALKTKNGKKFYGCSRYPECDFLSWKKPK
jgi:DNA topoisomerase-1